MISPAISIIIPNYNKGAFISATIESILHNSFKNWELVIVDDGSTDHSLQIIEQFVRNDNRIKLIKQANQGGAQARNVGLDAIQAPYFMFVDADDFISPFCLESRLKKADEFNEFDGWIFPMQPFRDGHPEERMSTWRPPEDQLLAGLIGHELSWSTVSPLWRTQAIKGKFKFNPRYHRLQDVQFHTEIVLSGIPLKTFPKVPADCYYRLIADSKSSKDMFILKWISSCEMYVQEYTPQVDDALKKKILKTFMRCLETAGHFYRRRQINENAFNQAIAITLRNMPSRYTKVCIQVYRQVLKLPFHVRGAYRVFSFLLTL